MSGRILWRSLRLLAPLTACVLLVLPGTAEAGQRHCAAAEIPEPFVLPDGSEHAAGSLKICKLQKHYPSTTLMVGYVDGRNVGMLLGLAGHNEADESAEPFMIFARDDAGKLRLYGYGLHDGGGMATFTLHRPDRLAAALRLPGAPPA